MKKIIMILLSVFVLSGCITQTINLDKPVYLSFFYISTCAECKSFKKNAIPLLENTFGKKIKIKQYDLDDEKTQPVYDKIIDSLVDFDEEFYGQGPFIVLDDYFAILGYTSGDEEFLIQDIQKAVQKQPLGYELEGMRFLFKESS